MPSSDFGRRARSLSVALLILVAAFAALIAVLPGARAASPNYISGSACVGNPSPKWQTGDTWIMYGDVTVPTGCTLTIEPGATVKGDPNVHLYIDGALVAGGGSTNLAMFVDNQTSVTPWYGIVFNSGSTGSVTWSSFQRVLIAVTASSSSPVINNNTITQSGAGVRLDTSGAFVADNIINGMKVGAYGVVATSSSTTITRNKINGTNIGIQATVAGSLTISGNTITNVSGSFAMGIYVSNLASVSITGNTIGGGLGGPVGLGAAGSPAVAILANGTPAATIDGNTVSDFHGGRGGTGPGSAIGAGGAGGMGGSAAGIAVGSGTRALIQRNTVDGIFGGRGGDGGTSALGGGGRGGRGGDGIGIEVFAASTAATYLGNAVSNVSGGNGGEGGAASSNALSVGAGGGGGSGYGLFSYQGMNPDISSNTIRFLRGGRAGNATASPGGSGTGGMGGETNGIIALVDGTALVHANTVTSLDGGAGGNGITNGGTGGNATAIIALADGSPFNSTTVSFNQVSSASGGAGGIGGTLSGDGGYAGGIALLHVTAALSSNAVSTVRGGAGGTAFVLTNQASRGGDAAGIFFLADIGSTSLGDGVQSVTRGAPGSGKLPPLSNGIGIYFAGDGTVTTRVAVTNGTLASIGDYDVYVDNYTAAVTLNTPFAMNKVAVQQAGNLTVRNYLDVNVLWPNSVTPVAGATITVTDNAATVYSQAAATGSAQWIVVTNRVYVDSPVPKWNATVASVAYLAYTFASNPRAVNMTSSQTQTFTMNDTTAPTSAAQSLPAWEATRTFAVAFNYSDGYGVGVASVALWYSLNGSAWQQYSVQIVGSGGTGSFTFTATSDGTYQFATIATDGAGNAQGPSPPTTNTTWTIVDTTKPASRVNALPAWETSLSFIVSWGPDAGTTDIAFYQVQYNAGGGWVTWLGDTTLTSGTFTATGQGVYQFRTLAHDRAGNVEAKTGNDTWTHVDTIPPSSAVTALPAYETALSFSLSWGPSGGTSDIANYSIEVSVDGGAWTTWFAGATNASATFTGSDGHRYAFRSLAIDRAGNRETKGSANDTWTFVDTTPPVSAVAGLPRYEASLVFTLSWGPAGGTTDIATFTIQVSDDGGAWTPLSGSVNTAARTASFTGADGHTYAFRSLATDRAGNVEAKSGNDTFTSVDVTRPSVTAAAPEGAGVGTSPTITITFSERMDPTSTQQAVSLAPSMDGNFTWNAAGTQLTFTPSRPLQPGTSYTVVVDTSAKDVAGNSLVAVKTFTFTTAAASLDLASLWPLFVALAAIVLVAVVLLMRRRGSAETTTPAPVAPVAPAPPTQIDDVFLLYKDGVLIKHETLRLRPDIDTDILSGMLTAVQQFVKDSFQGDEEGDLNEITVGQMHLHLGRGKWLILAARVSGGDVTTMGDQIKKCIEDMEMHHWDQLEDWDGDMALARVMAPYLKRLIHGDYA